MADRYQRLEDDRELAPAPVRVPCERCGRAFLVHEDDADDETHLCLPCVNATVSQPMPCVGWDEALFF